jgi:hypothetical protein
MEDLSALATRIATSAGALRGCLILSRDGLVLGAYPPEAEAALKPAWLRFATLGESDKGFVEFGDELWAYARRGAYGAFAVAEVSVRPGLLLDQLEQALLVADQDRTDKRDSLRIPDAPTAPSGKPRTNLHKEARPAPERAAERAPAEQRASAPGAAPTAPSATPPSGAPGAATPRPAPSEAAGPGTPPPPEAPSDVQSSASQQDAGVSEEPEEAGEVDRVLLAQEFSRLLQEPGLDDEA